MDKRSLMLGLGTGLLAAAALLQWFAPPEEQMKERTEEQTPAVQPAPAVSAPPPAVPAAAPVTEAAVREWAGKHGFVLLKQSDWQVQQQKLKQLEAAGTANKVTTIYIPSGLSSQEVERMLVQSGLLPPQNDFSRLIKERGLARKMRTGMFTFEGSPSLDVILQKITSR